VWHHDAYPRLLQGEGRSVNAYIALSDVDETNGFEYLPASLRAGRQLNVVNMDPFSGNQFFAVPPDLEKRAVPVRLRAGQFVLFSDQLVHRSVRNTNGRTRVALTLRVAPPSLRILRGYSPRYGPIAI
jgi:Protein involved in biosynthesis of mitomycin antibiotics/polyketide fumonisin